MANHKSAIKRDRQNKRRNLRNKSRKTAVKTATKKVLAATADGSAADDAKSLLTAAQKLIDKTAAKGTIHKRTAARKISRLAKRVNNMS